MNSIMKYFPKIDYYNKNLLDEYYLSYTNHITPLKENYEYPIHVYDILHYYRHKLNTEYNDNILYEINFKLGNIIKPELSNLISNLYKQQKLINISDIYDQEELNKQINSMSINSSRIKTNLSEELNNISIKNTISKKRFSNKISKKNIHFIKK